MEILKTGIEADTMDSVSLFI